jgi:hypothetical protein
MTPTSKSLNVHKAQSRDDAKRTRASLPHTNPPRSQDSKAAAHTAGTGAGSRVRSVSICVRSTKPRRSSTHRPVPFADSSSRVHCPCTGSDASSGFPKRT